MARVENLHGLIALLRRLLKTSASERHRRPGRLKHARRQTRPKHNLPWSCNGVRKNSNRSSKPNCDSKRRLGGARRNSADARTMHVSAKSRPPFPMTLESQRCLSAILRTPLPDGQARASKTTRACRTGVSCCQCWTKHWRRGRRHKMARDQRFTRLAIHAKCQRLFRLHL